MDAMALLCTLHADGPATLKRLRQAGCATIEALERLGAERVAELLGCTPASARRLQGEAARLRARLDGTPIADAHALDEVPAPLPSTGFTPEPPPVDARSSHSAEEPGESLAVELPAREKRLVQRVVEAWRHRDSEDALISPANDGFDAPRSARPEERGEELAVVPQAELGAALHAGDLDGLDAQLVATFATAGIQTLDRLASSDPVVLARQLPGVGFSRLSRLVSLAKRAQGPARGPARVFATPLPCTDTAKISRSELPFALRRPDTAFELPEDLKTTPAPAPKERPTRFEAEREGAGGPFV